LLFTVSPSTDVPAPEITKQLSIFQSLRVKHARPFQFASRQAGGLPKRHGGAGDFGGKTFRI